MKLTEASYRITQKIWGSTDCVLLIFAGCSAEFAAIKAVDWLFFTNRLPSAPLDRLFDTVRYAQFLFFSQPEEAAASLEKINAIHGAVEKSRGEPIPNWGYKDVLFMLIHYSEVANKVVFGSTKIEDRIAYFEAAMEVGKGMHLRDLPKTYEEYLVQRAHSLTGDYENSKFTLQLFEKYREHLGGLRYRVLRAVQASIFPEALRKKLNLKKFLIIDFLLTKYHYFPCGGEKLRPIHKVILPQKYYKQLKDLRKPPNYFASLNLEIMKS